MTFYDETLETSFGRVVKDDEMIAEMVKTYRTFNLAKQDEMALEKLDKISEETVMIGETTTLSNLERILMLKRYA